MSDIQLSPELFQTIQQAIIKQEPEAQQDPSLMMQYLAALMGYILGSQQMPTNTKESFIEELADFARHVMRDADAKVQQQRQAQAANAFGYWNPPAN